MYFDITNSKYSDIKKLIFADNIETAYTIKCRNVLTLEAKIENKRKYHM